MTPYGDAQRIEAELRALFESASELKDELRASLARYACVLVSSYLEAIFRELAVAYTRARASEQVLRYVDHSLGGFRDPNMEKILQLVGRFDADYRQQLETQTSGKLKDSVDSISANRNNIAHGRRSGISLGQVHAYYEDVRIVVARTRAILGV